MQGWQKTSFIDYPGKIASVFFYGGCNFRCEFCHNGDLVLPNKKQENISEETVIAQISKKKHLYEGIVLTGGEPTLVPNIEEIIEEIIDKTGLPVKLDTNGTSPDKLKRLIDNKLVDYVAMDIKTSITKYPLVFFNKEKADELIAKILESIKLLKESKVSYEFRSTLYPPYFEESDLPSIVELVKGASNYNLQQYNPRHTLEDCTKEVFPTSKITELQKYFSQFVKHCEIR